MKAAVAAAAAAAGVFIALKARRALKLDCAVYVLKNQLGMEVHIAALGATIQRMLVPDMDGKVEDVVLGFDAPNDYMSIANPYFGGVVGRCANRIARGRFTLDGATYQLATNNGPNHLHGGAVGLNKRVFESKLEEDATSSTVVLTYTSADGEEGYPGDVTITVRYELSRFVNELRCSISATVAGKATPVNLAQHTYFNLAGHAAGTVLDHLIKINGDHYTPVGPDLVPTGEIASVLGTPFDFTAPTTIGARINRTGGGYDHNYVLFGMGTQARSLTRPDGTASSSPRLAATVTDPKTGRTLDVLTTAPGMQFYTGNFLNGKGKGKGGAKYGKHGGFCLETQGFPDAVNQPNFPSVVIQPGETYRHEVVYKWHYSPLTSSSGNLAHTRSP